MNQTGQFLSENVSGGQHLNKVQMYQNKLNTCLLVLNNTFQSSEVSLNLHGHFLFLSELNICTCKKFILFICNIFKLFFLETCFFSELKTFMMLWGHKYANRKYKYKYEYKLNPLLYTP